ncbi:MAG: S24/S26 family peptidase [Bacteroidales bacterium]|nr:S24/S26 family peptidase [Bacteroidales bacterium]
MSGEEVRRRELPNEVLLPEVAALLAAGSDVTLLTKGNSMLPFIRGGRDSVRLRKFPAVAPGDIVLARLPAGNYVLHRVLRADGGALTLMGDGNVRGTESCRAEDVAGTVVAVVRPDGRERAPGRARAWKALRPLRRYLLAAYRRLFKRNVQIL